MKSHVQIVAHLSQVNVWNKNNGKMENIYNAREHMKNIFCSVYFQILFQFFRYLPQLNPFFSKEDITFPLS